MYDNDIKLILSLMIEDSRVWWKWKVFSSSVRPTKQDCIPFEHEYEELHGLWALNGPFSPP